MHTSYVSLAVFAMGAAAVSNMPKPDGNPFDGSTFPFMPSGTSAVEDDDGMSNPAPAYMAAMEAVEESQGGAYNNPKPIQQAAPSSIAHVKPSPAFSAVYEYSSSMSIMVSVPASSSMAPMIIQATPAPESMPMEMAPVTIIPMPVSSAVQTPIAKPSSFITRPIITPTSITVPKPEAHSLNIHDQHLASMSASSSVMHATSSSATPSPSADVADDATSMLSKVPILGGLLSGLAGIF